MGDINTLLNMDIKAGLLFVVTAIVVFCFLIQKWDWLLQRFGVVTKKQLAEETQENAIQQLKNHTTETDQKIDRLFECLSEMKEGVDLVSTQVSTLQKRVNENDVSKMGDRLMQSFRYYSQKKQWTGLEKWAFDNLVHSYKDSGGDSWIDDLVVPTSKTWQIVDDN